MTTNTVSTFTPFAITTIPEISFIAGTYRELTYDVYNIAGSPVDISTYTYKLLLCPYGEPNTVSLSKDGVLRTPITNRFTIYLYSTDTVALSGKYVQQPVLIGNPGYEFRLGQGYITIIPTTGV